MTFTPDTLRSMLAAASKGPWRWGKDKQYGLTQIQGADGGGLDTSGPNTPDAILMEAAPELARQLLAMVEREKAADRESSEEALRRIARAAESSSPDAHYLGNLARQALNMEPLPNKERVS